MWLLLCQSQRYVEVLLQVDSSVVAALARYCRVFIFCNMKRCIQTLKFQCKVRAFIQLYNVIQTIHTSSLNFDLYSFHFLHVSFICSVLGNFSYFPFFYMGKQETGKFQVKSYAGA